MAQGRRRKCKCCRRLFRPDPRNRHHQRYCSQPRCRAVRKAECQTRWLARRENHDYFRGPVHLARMVRGGGRDRSKRDRASHLATVFR